MKRLYKILFILPMILSGCSSGTIKEGELIGENIIDIVSSGKLDSLPSVIKLYNTIEDSLVIYDNNGIEKLNSGIIKATEEKNDTIKLCARIVMNSPEGVGSWLAGQNVKKILNSATFTPESLQTEISIIDMLYKKTGEPSSINEFRKAFDAHIDSLTIKEKAIVYTRTLKPSDMAKALAMEMAKAASEKDMVKLSGTQEMIKHIRKEYSSDKKSMEKFNDILSKSLNILPDSIIKTINSYQTEKNQ